MRLLFFLLAGWVLAAVVLGFTGGAILKRFWTEQAEQAIRRDALAAIALTSAIDAQQAPGPLESSQAWQAIENQLNLGIIPIDATHENVQADTRLAVEWNRSAADGYRISINARAPDGKSADESTPSRILRVTRQVDASRLSRTWWICWGLLNCLAGSVAFASWWTVGKQTWTKKRVLEPWFEALQTAPKPNSAGLLPPVGSDDDDLTVRLDSLAESINQVYTELRNTSERSDLVLGNLREGVLAVDDRSNILLANRSLRRLLELDNGNYLYRPLLEVIRAPVLNSLIQRVLKEQVPVEQETEYGQAARHLRVLGRPLPLDDERTGVIVTVRDETLLKRVDMIKRDFISNASHELKTPLAAIRAYAETLQLGAIEDPEAVDGFIANIISQADRLDELVKGMLQLSRVEEGQVFNFQSFDVLRTVEPCIMASRAVARSKGVELAVLSPEHPTIIKSDRDGFQTIVSNLLSNGVRYTETGGRVTVVISSEEETLKLDVQDTGIGMSPSDLERVFERFYRAQKDRSTATGGTGLGLSIVKHLVQALGGSISASSALNVGSTFTVRLPLKPTADVNDG